jgi:hypothetical protein
MSEMVGMTTLKVTDSLSTMICPYSPCFLTQSMCVLKVIPTNIDMRRVAR